MKHRYRRTSNNKVVFGVYALQKLEMVWEQVALLTTWKLEPCMASANFLEPAVEANACGFNTFLFRVYMYITPIIQRYKKGLYIYINQNQLSILDTDVVVLFYRAHKMNLHLLSMQCCHPACPCLHTLGDFQKLLLQLQSNYMYLLLCVHRYRESLE